MEQTRRNWLRTTGGLLAGVALAGCTDDATESAAGEPDDDGPEYTEEDLEEPEIQTAASDIGVASEWNAIRTRLRDPVILGHAGEFSTGAAVVGDIFERFETAAGENNAHEALEHTREEHYEGFEHALGELRDALQNGDIDRAHEAMRSADDHLQSAQAVRTDQETAQVLSLLVMGAHVADCRTLLELDDHESAAQEFAQISTEFEESGLQEMAADADSAAADAFVDALEQAQTAAQATNAADATAASNSAFDAAMQGAHSLAGDSVAGAAHIAALQGRGWDAAALSQFGGPSRAYAHAAALNEYRARARDAVWLYESGQSEAASKIVQEGLERFETARAHDALEEADHEAYESFEAGLETLKSGIESQDDSAVSDAVETVDATLRTGIAALVSADQEALLEAGYAKIRVEDAVERYRLGDTERALELVEAVLADFEADAGGFHETLEELDHELYETFEHDHLEGLIEALEQDDAEAVETHVEGLRDALLSFETRLGSDALVSGVEAGYLAARARDASVLATLGASERGTTVVSDSLAYFESGAGGFHDAIEEADHETYDGFEQALETLQSAFDGDAEEEATLVAQRATEAIYTVVASSGGGDTGAAGLARDIFAHFEDAAVHDVLEESDHERYEAFESALDEYIQALEGGSGVGEAAEGFATAALAGQFAVAGAPDEAPVDSDGHHGENNDDQPSLDGGPNVVEGVPEEADHVVDMQAVAFDPEQLTVQQGDTVAWRFAAGEPHSVSAYEDEIPDEAEYWASGGFESESAAREGWEDGRGAIQEGQSYVRTFETAGTHEYVCIPHEAAGMVGTLVVEAEQGN